MNINNKIIVMSTNEISILKHLHEVYSLTCLPCAAAQGLHLFQSSQVA